MSNELKPIEMPALQTPLLEDEILALANYLRNTKTLSTGPESVEFEKEFTAFIGCTDSVALCNCSAALELCALFSGIGKGDEVIVPAHTFVASVVPFARTGAKIVWADIEPDTFEVSAKSIKSLITPKTKVIVVVHLYGCPADLDSILAIAKEHNLIVVEDCAQAPGALYKGKRVGSFGDFGCFSFHSHKNITTLGEGGILTVKKAEFAIKARRLRWMGNWPFEMTREKYWKPAMGNVIEPVPNTWPFNYCIGEPNAMIGRVLLKRLDKINDRRNVQAKKIKDAMKDFPEIQFQKYPDNVKSASHLFPATYDGTKYNKTKDDLIDLLYSKYKLKLIVQYWPLNQTELFSKMGFGTAKIPNTEKHWKNMISFPWWSDMTDSIIDDIVNRLRSALTELRKAK